MFTVEPVSSNGENGNDSNRPVRLQLIIVTCLLVLLTVHSPNNITITKTQKQSVLIMSRMRMTIRGSILENRRFLWTAAIAFALAALVFPLVVLGAFGHFSSNKNDTTSLQVCVGVSLN